MTCQCCGDSFGALTSSAKYCSDACKQKAYRQRRQQRKVANERTMHMDDYNILKICINWHEDVANVLESIKNQHGQQAMIDAAHLAAWMSGLGQYSS